MLEVRNVTKRFGNLVAVKDVSMSVKQGELRAIIGPNGAGKTTFFNMISGYFPPTAGSILFDGKDVTQTPAYKRVGLGKMCIRDRARSTSGRRPMWRSWSCATARLNSSTTTKARVPAINGCSRPKPCSPANACRTPESLSLIHI